MKKYIESNASKTSKPYMRVSCEDPDIERGKGKNECTNQPCSLIEEFTASV